MVRRVKDSINSIKDSKRTSSNRSQRWSSRDNRWSNRWNYGVSDVVGEILLIAVAVALAAAIATLVYVWASGMGSPPHYISCNYDSGKFTVVKGPDVKIRWSDCAVTLYNDSNNTAMTINVDGNNLIKGGDIIDVSKYVSPGNSYILTIISKKSSTVLYTLSWYEP